MFDQGDGNGNVVCKIRDQTWAATPSEYCQRGAVPGATGEPGSDLMLGQGNPPCVSSAIVQIFFSAPYAAAPLGYGQTHTVDTITCDSEPSGVTALTPAPVTSSGCRASPTSRADDAVSRFAHLE